MQPHQRGHLLRLKHLLSSHCRGGGIVNVLSTETIRPTGMLASYGAAKAGLMAITQSMAVELGQHGIYVNAVVPGATMTAERIAAMQSNATKAPFAAAPTDAPQTLAKQREMLQTGGVCDLPFRLMAEAVQERHAGALKAARKAQLAVAIALLTVAPVRIGNLIATKLNEHLFKLAGPNGRYWLEYQPHEVKNNVDLQLELDDDTTALLNEYIHLHRPVLMRGSNEAWLFPGTSQKHKAPHQLSAQIRDLVEKRTGLRITAHQFRHAAAAMLLIKYPNNWPLIAKILGHKGWATTIKNYAEVDKLRGHKLFLDIVAEVRALGKAA